MKKFVPYALVLALGAAAIVGVLALTGNTGGGGKSKADTASAALVSAFNKDAANAAKGITIVKVKTCEDISGKQGAPANTFACTATVGGVDPATSCGGFIFEMDAKLTQITKIDYAQPIDPSNCT